MKKPFFTVSMLFLSGCVTDTQTYMPNGSVGHHVTCGGAIFSMGDCYKRAGELCGRNGFTVIGENKESTAFSSGHASVGNGYGVASVNSGSIVNRDLLVECKK